MRRHDGPAPSTPILRLAVAMLALALVAAACSSGSTDDEATATSTPVPVDDTTEDTATDSDSDDGASTDDPVVDEPTAAEACNAEPVVLTADGGVDFVRTPDACFVDLPDWPYEPQYVEIDGLRQAYVDEGPADGDVVLLLHGQPSWSYLYRDMIPVFADAGYRVIAMDHLGMGRSDKPTDIDAYTYLGHGDRLLAFIDELDLYDINLFVQDWGSLIGLRIAGENPDRFATITVGNGALPQVPAGLEPFPAVENPDEGQDLASPFAAIPDQQEPFYDRCELLESTYTEFFPEWMTYAMTAESFTAGEVLEALTWFDLEPEEEAAYDAPFPSREYMAGVRTFPSLVNQLGGTTADAWAGLQAFERPFLTLWADNDPGNLGSCAAQAALVDGVPGAAGQPHDRLAEASHFLQDDQGTEIATRMVDWLGGAGADTDEGAVLGQADTSLPGELIQSGYDGPFFMVNLIEFRDQAVYADGRETDLTGVEANNLYGQTGVQVLVGGGMRPALAGAVDADAAPEAVPAWDQVAIARYPSYQEFFALSQSPELQVGLEHKDAGVETTIVIPTLRVEDAPLAAELPPADDPVVLFEIFSHGGDGTTDRPEPLSDYLDALAADASDLGGVALGTYEVQGVLIGDGREWDEAHLWWFADRADLDALLADADLAAATAARDEVLTDHYRLVLEQVQVEPLGRQP